MKFLVKSQLDMRFVDGSSYQLTPGIHDNLPENVQQHWAFSSCAEKISDSDAVQNVGGSDEAKITELQAQIAGLLGQVETLTASNITLTEEQASKDKTITELQAQIAGLKAPATPTPEEVTDAKKPKPADSK